MSEIRDIYSVHFPHPLGGGEILSKLKTGKNLKEDFIKKEGKRGEKKKKEKKKEKRKTEKGEKG